jgi:excisionase family DNA binding protein
MAERGYLTVTETARRLGVSRPAVYKRMLGGLAFVPLGRHRYISRKVLAKFVGKGAAEILGIETKRPRGEQR